jgi:hypothetical protein
VLQEAKLSTTRCLPDTNLQISHLSFTTCSISHVSHQDKQLISNRKVLQAFGYCFRLLCFGVILTGCLQHISKSPILQLALNLASTKSRQATNIQSQSVAKEARHSPSAWLPETNLQISHLSTWAQSRKYQIKTSNSNIQSQSVARGHVFFFEARHEGFLATALAYSLAACSTYSNLPSFIMCSISQVVPQDMQLISNRKM